MRTGFLFLVLSVLLHANSFATLVDFEDLTVPTNGYYNGSDLAGGFVSGSAFFQNSFETNFNSWSGFAYSEVNDPTTPGFGNQYAVSSGTGFGGTGTYAVAFDSSFDEQDIISFPQPSRIAGFYVNNTTYPALSMRDGDAFS